jgi:hypothetical protein
MFRISIYFILISIISLLSTSCKKEQGKESASTSATQFKKMSSSETGITFNNKLTETEEENALIFDGYYTGAGSAILDVNNDGLEDVMFVSNQGPDKLYLNKGNFKFEDISKSAGIEGGDEWGGGITVADVNADGWDDIYVCNSLYLNPERRRNKLYINNKNNTFTDRAKSYGLDDAGFSTQATFFDYDLDGDLDVFVVNQPPNHNTTRDSLMATNEPNWQYTSKLYKNNGNETFTDVTEQAGVKTFSFGLSATVGDYFNDGFPDIYLANDYDYGDYLFINSGDGTFKNFGNYSLRHISNFSMGVDAADINNDGWLDLFVADMTPEDHYRNKTNMAAMDPAKFWKMNETGNNFQYMVNTLQLNQGNGFFSEIGQMAGVAKTDWSWSALFSDFDNDGFKDLFVANGIMRDIRNRDFITYAFKAVKDKSISRLKIMEKGPSVPIRNYIFKNDKSLHFTNMAADWGLTDESFSQGASYGDLDNDGDIDLIVNNMNQEAFVYQNQTSDKKEGNFVRIKLEGAGKNLKALGARVLVAYGDRKIQMAELTNARGYMSSSEPVLHFGIGDSKQVDSIFVRWQGGKYIRVDNIQMNTVTTIREKDAKVVMNEQLFQVVPFVLTDEVSSECFNEIKHVENKYDDFKKEVLIPYKESSLGPALESGDINKDGLEDIFLGSSAGAAPQLLIQNKSGKFIASTSNPWSKYKNSEILDVLFFDADKDGDTDIYTASGSNEFPTGSDLYLDHLYLNNGKGEFTDATNHLPALSFSKSVVRNSDIDGDGDQDLFVGGRLVPGKYGLSERSAILINNNGNFEDKTAQLNPLMSKDFECVTDACWVDLDQDKDEDLVVVGEWAPVRIFKNDKGKLTEVSATYKTDSLFGWWNSIQKKDLNGDGLQDLVLGNLGMNLKFKASKEKPFSVFVNDFDGNGTWDTYLATKSKDGKLFPVRGKQCSSEQMPFISDKFKTYDQFAKASLDEILEGKMKGSIRKIATEFHSMVLMNNGNNSFTQINLPAEAQISSVQSMAFYDFNKDGIDDILLGGNFYSREVETARSDASVGLILINTGNGVFLPLSNAVSGLKLYKDLRELRIVRGSGVSYIVAANNNDKLDAFKIK